MNLTENWNFFQFAKRHGSRKQHGSSLVSLSSFRFHFRNTFPRHVNTRPTEWLIIGGFGLAANNAAPLQPLPEFHTTVSSVNFECTRALSLSGEEDSRPDRIDSTNREEEGRGTVASRNQVASPEQGQRFSLFVKYGAI